MILPVKISIADSTELAYTIDITCKGARLAGVHKSLQPGETITLNRGSQKGKFRIIWVKQLGANEMQAGIEAFEPQPRFWGVDLSDGEQAAKNDVQALMTLLSRAPASKKG